ncbi:hypothetical protein BT63DRAFT_425003 [Microthyrium microscopicum]|uniref:BTB domain-containing protein n=1 Tax=Microthyrium microscopicum TaxID=703497 RepID=A0A6A6UCA9_9PEZI|nr:hypothetical protein BT63DRAFT_425003 [Microthyrium microscopicum]
MKSKLLCMQKSKKYQQEGSKKITHLILPSLFARFAKQACRRGDLKTVHEKIAEGININSRDIFDYTPLILASLCGQYEVAQLLLESGALCERDTFQGERCLYNALTDRIKNLLLSFDFSKSTSPLQPLAAYFTSLLGREHPKTWDLSLTYDNDTIHVHKFILASRSPYFAKKLETSPEITSWRLPNAIPFESIYTAIRFLYFSEVAIDLGDDQEEEEILRGIDKFSRQIEVERLFDFALKRDDRRLTRQRMSDELTLARDEVNQWFQKNILKNKIVTDTILAKDVKWVKDNAIFADVILRADEVEEEDISEEIDPGSTENGFAPSNTLPIGSFKEPSKSSAKQSKARKSVLFPVQKAMLLRSEFFLIMFSSAFKEAQETEHLQIIPIDCSPECLEVVLTFLYTEKADFSLSLAIEVLFAADLLLLEKLKVKAATTISSLASGAPTTDPSKPGDDETVELINIYDVIRAGWDVRVNRLEEFGARYIANRLEECIDEEDFAQLVKESAQRVKNRQETDTIELVDDIRYYLSERFKMRFEDAGIDVMEDENLLTEDELLATKVDGLELEDGSAPAMPDDFYAGVIRTLDGEDVEDEFEEEARNYQILLGKIDALLDRLRLDA